jgi:hypothetical protein
MRRLSTSIAIALLGTALVVGTATATTRVVIEKNSVAPLLFDGLDTCLADYGFTYTGEYTRVRSTTEYWDGDTLVRTVIQIHFDGIETNDLDPSLSLRASGERLIVLDHLAGTATETGTLRHVTVRGEGVVLLQTGRFVSDLETNEILTVNGPHQFLFDDFSAFCEALGG